MNSSKIRENHCKNIMFAFLPVFCVINPYVRNGAHETNNTTIKNFNLNGKGGEIKIKNNPGINWHLNNCFLLLILCQK